MFIFTKKDNIYIVNILFITIFFILNLSIYYSKYLDIKYEEVYKDKVQVLNIYKKKDFNILKLSASNYNFFTSVPKDLVLDKLDHISIVFITKELTFYDFLKGFYTKTINVEKLNIKTKRQDISKYISSLHENDLISQLFNALFLAIPVNSELREVFTNYSISHLIALSGFHIVVLSFIVYWIVYYPYFILQKKYFPYRNRKSDILIITFILIFLYLIFTGFVPSLVRAFIMLMIGFVILRSNIKLFSFKTLGMTFLIAISFFPNFLFSIGFWFSIGAVFYIFLYLQYFKHINKYVSFIFFNIWIFLVFNPIVHFFYENTTLEQLLSPILTIAFTLLYPIEIILHIMGFGNLLDTYLLDFINYEFDVYQKYTNLNFLLLFIFLSIFSIFSKKIFYALNILISVYNIYLFLL
ncbi:competence protein [Malaciobacter pacificus]|uniref:Competence protein, ComEC family n=1 Tax=Malaciobacter pacificus TaxID=1080223 RepID=A0A5C2HBR1_9BACT|nr:ComEC/Rec2 family competence protein [Malaciobacter pacificus]QEP34636.1 competence protein, ComEC family [Malaciobacter pacificus]GGD37192.1 competence protein [Malaciobacter pacificus]